MRAGSSQPLTPVFHVRTGMAQFPYYKASVLAQHVDYFATEYVAGLYERAEEKYSNKDYTGALEDLEKNYTVLKISEPEFLTENLIRQEKDISCLKKLIELNKKIEKDPKNYKLILEHADIKAHPKMFESVL